MWCKRLPKMDKKTSRCFDFHEVFFAYFKQLLQHIWWKVFHAAPCLYLVVCMTVKTCFRQSRQQNWTPVAYLRHNRLCQRHRAERVVDRKLHNTQISTLILCHLNDFFETTKPRHVLAIGTAAQLNFEERNIRAICKGCLAVAATHPSPGAGQNFVGNKAT